MFKLIMISCLLATALAAPPVAPGATVKRETPASTSKLTPLVGPIVSPIAHIPLAGAPILPQISPYAYTYSGAYAPVAYIPGGYSIDQYGYHIAH